MKKITLIILLYWLWIPNIIAQNYDIKIQKAQKNKRAIVLSLQSRFTIFSLRGIVGAYEMNEKGFFFYPLENMTIFEKSNYHLYKDKCLFIDWQDIGIIKRKSSSMLAPFSRDILLIQLKNGKRYYFSNNDKKKIIKTYKTYMGIVDK